MSGVETSAAVVDASVAVKWFVPERGSEQAVALLERRLFWHAPRLMVVEFAGALRRKVVAGEISGRVARDALDSLLGSVAKATIALAEDEGLVARALALALAGKRKLPDFVYVALAEREGLALATADGALAAAARSLGVPVLAVGEAAA